MIFLRWLLDLVVPITLKGTLLNSATVQFDSHWSLVIISIHYIYIYSLFPAHHPPPLCEHS